MAYAKESGFHFREIKGNLFSCEKDTSLAHCVSADVHMGKGIAATFKKMFGGVDELRSQGNEWHVEKLRAYLHGGRVPLAVGLP